MSDIIQLGASEPFKKVTHLGRLTKLYYKSYILQSISQGSFSNCCEMIVKKT